MVIVRAISPEPLHHIAPGGITLALGKQSRGDGRMNLLMTRPQGAAERFVAGLPAELRACLTPVWCPLVAIEPVATSLETDDARGLIFTSSNGVMIAAGLTDRRDLPCYCVGQATTLAAQTAGWQATYAGTCSDELIRRLHQSRPEGPLLHIRGTHSRGNVAARLSALGCPTREQMVYDQPLLPLSDTARAALAGNVPVIAPLFSPRTARQFASLHEGSAPLFIATLSEAVARQVKGLKYNNLIVSQSPNAESMVSAIDRLVDDARRVEGDKPAQ